MSQTISVKTSLLLALVQGRSYGLELMDRVRERTKGAVQIGPGRTYPALRALERDGLLSSHEADPSPERGGRPKRYYELTAKGRAAAKAVEDIVDLVIDGAGVSRSGIFPEATPSSRPSRPPRGG